MSDTPDVVTRRSIPVPGGTCMTRMGRGAIGVLGAALSGSVNTARRALLAYEEGTDEELVELVRRELTNAGFVPRLCAVPEGPAARTLAAVKALFDELAAGGLTSDDAFVAVGGVDTLSACAFASGLWCGGMSCGYVPCDLNAALEASVRPRGIDHAGVCGGISCPGHPRVLVIDLDRIAVDDAPDALLARARMAAHAMGDGERALAQLAERAQDIAALDVDATGAQLLDSLRSSGRLACSNAVAVRQSVRYGVDIARALGNLVPGLAEWQCLAEALRLSSRLVLGVSDKADAEAAFAQDALLDRLGLPECGFEVDAEALAEELRRVCFATSNRFMLALPLEVGKVRLSVVPDEVLSQHLGAWCEAKRRLLARQRQA